MKEATPNKALSLKTLTKSTVWDVQENDIFRLLEQSVNIGGILSRNIFNNCFKYICQYNLPSLSWSLQLQYNYK